MTMTMIMMIIHGKVFSALSVSIHNLIVAMNRLLCRTLWALSLAII